MALQTMATTVRKGLLITAVTRTTGIKPTVAIAEATRQATAMGAILVRKGLRTATTAILMLQAEQIMVVSDKHLPALITMLSTNAQVFLEEKETAVTHLKVQIETLKISKRNNKCSREQIAAGKWLNSSKHNNNRLNNVLNAVERWRSSNRLNSNKLNNNRLNNVRSVVENNKLSNNKELNVRNNNQHQGQNVLNVHNLSNKHNLNKEVLVAKVEVIVEEKALVAVQEEDSVERS
jgi:hypothetical protein